MRSIGQSDCTSAVSLTPSKIPATNFPSGSMTAPTLASAMPNAKTNMLTPHRAGETRPSLSAAAEKTAIRKSNRIAELDFTKGALVLIMVLYHWLNYFVTGHERIYLYLRFLPTSFTFIAGFLIAQVYLSGYKKPGQQVPKRLLVRGVKLLAIVAFLNLAPVALRPNAFHTRLGDWSIDSFTMAYFTGSHAVAFSVLVPIAYLLILSAGLFGLSKHIPKLYHIETCLLVAGAVLCEYRSINSGYLQIISIGMLGISIGHVSLDDVSKLMKHPGAIFSVYFAYIAAVTWWNDSYLLQVIGVCISLICLYWVGGQDVEVLGCRRSTILLGRYSLFAYISQILILQGLRYGVRTLGIGMDGSIAAFFLCVVGTVLSVEIIDRLRNRVSAINGLYGAVFG